METKNIVRVIYLYLVTAITIVVLLISSIGMINLLLKEYVLNVKGWEELDVKFECEQPGPTGIMVQAENYDECIANAEIKGQERHANSVKMDFATYISMMLVGPSPLPCSLGNY